MKISVDASALEILEQAWARMPDVVRTELLASVTEADLLIEREVKERTPVGVGGGGGLKGSIASDEKAYSDRVIGMVGSPLNYVAAVELGTKPHFPPLQPIEDWVRAKLDVPEVDVEDVAMAIARKIKWHGTEGAHMFEQAFDATASQVQNIFALGVERIGAAMVDA